MTARFGSVLFFSLFFFLIPASAVFAEDNGETTSLMNSPFVIVGFLTLGVLMFYCIRES